MPQGVAFDRTKILEMLEPFFKRGYNRYKACALAGFDPSLLSKWEKKQPELSMQIDAWIEYPNMRARDNWIGEIEKGEYTPSKDWLERRDKESFSPKSEVEHIVKPLIVNNYDEAERDRVIGATELHREAVGGEQDIRQVQVHSDGGISRGRQELLVEVGTDQEADAVVSEDRDQGD